MNYKENFICMKYCLYNKLLFLKNYSYYLWMPQKECKNNNSALTIGHFIDCVWHERTNPGQCVIWPIKADLYKWYWDDVIFFVLFSIKDNVMDIPNSIFFRLTPLQFSWWVSADWIKLPGERGVFSLFVTFSAWFQFNREIYLKRFSNGSIIVCSKEKILNDLYWIYNLKF